MGDAHTNTEGRCAPRPARRACITQVDCVTPRSGSGTQRCASRVHKKTHNPREGWEDGTPPPRRDFKVGCRKENSSSPIRRCATFGLSTALRALHTPSEHHTKHIGRHDRPPRQPRRSSLHSAADRQPRRSPIAASRRLRHRARLLAAAVHAAARCCERCEPLAKGSQRRDQ